MRKVFKFVFFISAISLSLTACSSDKSAETNSKETGTPVKASKPVDPTTGCD